MITRKELVILKIFGGIRGPQRAAIVPFGGSATPPRKTSLSSIKVLFSW